MIDINALKIGYESGKSVEKVVSENLNMSLPLGHLVLLIGPNGSGKSTLLRTICKMQKPLGGTILIDDVNIDDLNEIDLAKKISVVQSTAPKIDNFTVREVVAFGRYPYSNIFGKLSSSDYEMVDKAIDMVGIEKLAAANFNAISDGEKQKAMIAKSLAQDTPYIIMDEPMAFLDYKSRIELFDLLKMMNRKENKGIVLSTHNLEMALRTADALWIFDGDSKFTNVNSVDTLDNNLFKQLFDEKTAEYLSNLQQKKV